MAGNSGRGSIRIKINTSRPAHVTEKEFLSLGMDSNLIRNRWETWDFNSRRLRTLSAGLAPAYLRLMGTDGDHMSFTREVKKDEPTVYTPSPGPPFPSSEFTMSARDWDRINTFAADVGWRIMFGFNAQLRDGEQWNADNAKDILSYSVEKGYAANLDLWTMRYCPPAVTCKSDFPWLNPYLFVSLYGWAVGIQLQPDSAVLSVHCQYLEMIPQSRSLVSSLPAPDRPELGPSTVDGYAPCSAICSATSVTGLPSVPSLPRPFSMTLFYAGPVHLVSITHVFDYRSVTGCVMVSQCAIIVLQSGIKQAIPRPSLLCARTIQAAECPPAPHRDTADCSVTELQCNIVVYKLGSSRLLRAPPCHAPTQFGPLNVIRRRFGMHPITPRLILLR